MTWTEGVTQISDTIFIGFGYSGLILFVVFILISIITIILQNFSKNAHEL